MIRGSAVVEPAQGQAPRFIPRPEHVEVNERTVSLIGEPGDTTDPDPRRPCVVTGGARLHCVRAQRMPASPGGGPGRDAGPVSPISRCLSAPSHERHARLTRSRAR